MVISSQHDPDVTMDKLRADMIMNVVLPHCSEKTTDKDTKYYINPTGRFVVILPGR